MWKSLWRDIVENFLEIVPEIVDAVEELFTSMIMMDICQDGAPVAQPDLMKDSITGMVGFAGTHKGMLAVHVPGELAMAITTSFLGMDVDEINEDVQDAIGEIANMLGGSVKSILSDKGKNIQLSLPTTIFGKEYNFVSQPEVGVVVIPMKTQAGILRVQLELEKG